MVKAAVVTAFDSPPRYLDFPDPVAHGKDEVVVDAAAAGLHPRVRSQGGTTSRIGASGARAVMASSLTATFPSATGHALRPASPTPGFGFSASPSQPLSRRTLTLLMVGTVRSAPPPARGRRPGAAQ